jgi:SAM-dependent methyltransferase
MKPANRHDKTVASFGDEWQRFDQSGLADKESGVIFSAYFSIFPWDRLPQNATGFDMGCGTGRWARHVAKRVGTLHCIDPSTALDVAQRNLRDANNVIFHSGGVDDGCLPEGSQDFGYSLGVLHHIPDTEAAMRACVRMLKPGAPFLVYLYYAFDNRSAAFRGLWRTSELGRSLVSRMPPAIKHFTTDLIAALVYFPLARLSKAFSAIGVPVSGLPLSFYRDRSFYTMRTDSRDRFGTPLEQRFSKGEIRRMMGNCGLGAIAFSASEPYWCAVGIKMGTPQLVGATSLQDLADENTQGGTGK